MSENKAPKKVVGQISENLLNRFKRINHQKEAAREWQGDLARIQQEIWDKISNELGLDLIEDNYTLDTETGEVKEQSTFKEVNDGSS